MADSTDIVTGAAPVYLQQEPDRQGLWRGYVIVDGRPHYFETRTNRDAALADARAGKERLVRPQLPTKIWRKG